jgi:hypothetical protein
MNYQVLTLYAFCRLALDLLQRWISKLPSSNGRGIAIDQRACATATAKQSCYPVYDDAGNNLNICSLLKFKFYLTDDLRIKEINAVCHVSLWSAAPVSLSHDTG